MDVQTSPGKATTQRNKKGTQVQGDRGNRPASRHAQQRKQNASFVTSADGQGRLDAKAAVFTPQRNKSSAADRKTQVFTLPKPRALFRGDGSARGAQSEARANRPVTANRQRKRGRRGEGPTRKANRKGKRQARMKIRDTQDTGVPTDSGQQLFCLQLGMRDMKQQMSDMLQIIKDQHAMITDLQQTLSEQRDKQTVTRSGTHKRLMRGCNNIRKQVWSRMMKESISNWFGNFLQNWCYLNCTPHNQCKYMCGHNAYYARVLPLRRKVRKQEGTRRKWPSI